MIISDESDYYNNLEGTPYGAVYLFMKERIIGGFFVSLITIIALLSGGIVTTCIFMIISIIGLWEYLRVHSMEKSILAYVDYVFTVILYLLIFFELDNFILPLLIVLLMILLAIYVFTFPKYLDIDIAKVLFSFIYVAIMMSFVVMIRRMDCGLYLAFYLLIASWGNDIFAYLTGRALGKHKMSPKVSPNKSVEGFIGGVLGAFVIGMLYAMAFPQMLPFTSPLWGGVVACVAAMTSVVGDLCASAIKRNHDVKDYSHLIPGHGGVIDRFDSVIYIAPIIYWLVNIISYIQ